MLTIEIIYSGFLLTILFAKILVEKMADLYPNSVLLYELSNRAFYTVELQQAMES